MVEVEMLELNLYILLILNGVYIHRFERDPERPAPVRHHPSEHVQHLRRREHRCQASYWNLPCVRSARGTGGKVLWSRPWLFTTGSSRTLAAQLATASGPDPGRSAVTIRSPLLVFGAAQPDRDDSLHGQVQPAPVSLRGQPYRCFQDS